MSFDAAGLARAIAAHGPVVRVVVAEVQGSAPREVGAAMLIWGDGQAGTIGGGALEYAATRAARDMLAAGETMRVTRAILGPDIGQCCGGAVALLSERFEAVPDLAGVYARKVEAGAGAPEATAPPRPRLRDGWFVEPVATRRAPVWIWGAGHVGRAIAAALAPLPGLAVTLVDTEAARLPAPLPPGVAPLVAADMPGAVAKSPRDAQHFVLTFSHDLDLALCDALLAHGFAAAGLIGSATKWARFRSRLGQMGHDRAAIERIRCPIGDPSLGKHPQAIAIGVAHALIMDMAKKEAAGPVAGWGTDDGRASDA